MCYQLNLLINMHHFNTIFKNVTFFNRSLIIDTFWCLLPQASLWLGECTSMLGSTKPFCLRTSGFVGNLLDLATLQVCPLSLIALLVIVLLWIWQQLGTGVQHTDGKEGYIKGFGFTQGIQSDSCGKFGEKQSCESLMLNMQDVNYKVAGNIPMSYDSFLRTACLLTGHKITSGQIAWIQCPTF